jgi:6-phosphofructokinase
MSKLKGNLLVAQSGGPTAVINNTVRGVVEEALKYPDIIGKIYGAKEGVLGLLQESFYDLGNQPADIIAGLENTPSSALGSARKMIGEQELEQICSILKKHYIRYVFFIGGNDSQDTARKLSTLANTADYELRVIGLPKTIDNDLMHTDHTPGYGSAGRYAAITAMDLDSELRALQSVTPVSILETFGQKHGWLPATAYLAKQSEQDGPHLIYIPEYPVSLEQILQDVQSCYERVGRVLMVVSEGLKDETGEPIGVFATGVDGGFSAKMYGGAAAKLRTVIFQKLGLPCRYCLPSAALQCSSLCQSETDRDEAYAVGVEGVRQAVTNDKSGYMVAIKRLADAPYKWTTELVELEKVANYTRDMPGEYYDFEKRLPTESFVKYARPLIGDELPNYVKLKD